MNYRELPEISEKQEKIIDLVFKFRFINRKQLQRYFGYKDAKSVNPLLKDLVEKKYLGRIYSQKLLENTKPAIYYLNNNGIIWNRYRKGEEFRVNNEQLDIKYLKKFYEDKNASQAFINHCVNLFEIYLQLRELEKNSKGKLEYQCITKTENWIREQLDEYQDFNDIKNCIPDIFFEKIKYLNDDEATSSTFFLELIDPQVPRYALRFKVKEYLRFRREMDWDTHVGNDGKFPIIIFIFQKKSKIRNIAKFIQQKLNTSFDTDDMIFLLTSYETVMDKGIGDSGIWKEIKAE